MEEPLEMPPGEESKPCSPSEELVTDPSLQVEISDAVSERDKVKFTVQTKIPPAPPRPDFEASREKLQRLGEGNSTLTREEFAKMKQELEGEYLAIFKKTVAMHEVFLQRLAAHPVLRRDHNFYVFLEYDQDLSVRGKNRKELLGGFFRNIVKSADEALITGVSGLKEVDEFFEHERTFLLEYHARVRDTCLKADRVMRSHKSLAEDYIPISVALSSLGTQEVRQLQTSFLKLAELFERLRKLEGRVASDEDLKLSDLLKYYMRDSQAAKDLLYRRLRALADYENANKALDRARMRNKEVKPAEVHQQLCCQRFEQLSASAKQELTDFKSRRISAFRKNLIELAELELKHAKASSLLLRNTLIVLKGDA
ncbi:sorting nexin-32 isoform X2 [Natator depressus]|uniref:sorting nexin-32 isoform X2 n=1 Tax=Natator depressus TaxID=27790 RepID=UPI003EB8BE11